MMLASCIVVLIVFDQCCEIGSVWMPIRITLSIVMPIRIRDGTQLERIRLLKKNSVEHLIESQFSTSVLVRN